MSDWVDPALLSPEQMEIEVLRHRTEIQQLRAELERLRAIEQRAQDFVEAYNGRLAGPIGRAFRKLASTLEQS